MKGLENKLYKGWLKELWLFSPEKRRLEGTPYCSLQLRKGGCSEVGVGLFSGVTNNSPQGNSLKLCQERFTLSARKNFFTEREFSHRNRLPREVVELPFLEAFEGCMDVALRDIL